MPESSLGLGLRTSTTYYLAARLVIRAAIFAVSAPLWAEMLCAVVPVRRFSDDGQRARESRVQNVSRSSFSCWLV
jgi:hypothetical protein